MAGRYLSTFWIRFSMLPVGDLMFVCCFGKKVLNTSADNWTQAGGHGTGPSSRSISGWKDLLLSLPTSVLLLSIAKLLPYFFTDHRPLQCAITNWTPNQSLVRPDLRLIDDTRWLRIFNESNSHSPRAKICYLFGAPNRLRVAPFSLLVRHASRGKKTRRKNAATNSFARASRPQDFTYAAIFPRGLFTVSLDGRSERGTIRSLCPG